jgi:hypothetical protein
MFYHRLILVLVGWMAGSTFMSCVYDVILKSYGIMFTTATGLDPTKAFTIKIFFAVTLLALSIFLIITKLPKKEDEKLLYKYYEDKKRR